MKTTLRFPRKIINTLFFSCLFCLTVLFSNSCWGQTLSPADKAKADKLLADHGRDAITYYLTEMRQVLDAYSPETLDEVRDTLDKVHSGTDQNIILNYLKYFVSKGADVNLKDVNGFTPLHVMAVIWRIDLVEFLVSQGANVNAKSNNGFTPLHLPAGYGRIDVVKFLVSKGADVNAKDNDGVTPLHFAARSGDVEVVKFLVSKGADANAKANNGKTSLDVAKTGRNTVVIEYLIRSQFTDEELAEIGKFLAEYRDFEDDVKTKDEYGNTLLHKAVNEKNDAIAKVKYLVSKGADVNVQNTKHEPGQSPIRVGNTPLHDAVTRGRIDLVTFLVSEGADINMKCESYGTPLHNAVFYENVEITKYLVSQGADINAKGYRGMTPLHFGRDVEIAKYLVSKMADVNAEDGYGDTPLCPFGVYCFRPDLPEDAVVEKMKFLVSQGANVNAKGMYDRTPLFKVNSVAYAEYLVSQGADVNAKDAYGQTPLHQLIYHLEFVKFLVSKGANVNAKDKNGNTPLDLAKESGNAKEVAEYLSSIDAKSGKK